jgi:hypothetical protein
MAHEAGHGHFFKGGGKGIGKAVHKNSLSLLANMGKPIAIVSGAISGKDAAEKEEYGEKQDKLSRHASWAAPTIA